jgi:hypothetical protein
MIQIATDLRKLSGATGIRTPDLLHAMQALYQLSYSPSCAGPNRPERPASVQETG